MHITYELLHSYIKLKIVSKDSISLPNHLSIYYCCSGMFLRILILCALIIWAVITSLKISWLKSYPAHWVPSNLHTYHHFGVCNWSSPWSWKGKKRSETQLLGINEKCESQWKKCTLAFNSLWYKSFKPISYHVDDLIRIHEFLYYNLIKLWSSNDWGEFWQYLIFLAGPLHLLSQNNIFILMLSLGYIAIETWYRKCSKSCVKKPKTPWCKIILLTD